MGHASLIQKEFGTSIYLVLPRIGIPPAADLPIKYQSLLKGAFRVTRADRRFRLSCFSAEYDHGHLDGKIWNDHPCCHAAKRQLVEAVIVRLVILVVLVAVGGFAFLYYRSNRLINSEPYQAR